MHTTVSQHYTRLITEPSTKVVNSNHCTRVMCTSTPKPAGRTAAVVLRRLARATSWSDLEQVFGVHESQLSEILWGALMVLVSERVGLVMDTVCASFWSEQYATTQTLSILRVML